MAFFLVDNFYARLTSVILFGAAALTDLADGHYARKHGIVTKFGQFMDPLADKILVSTALISFTALKLVPALPVMLIIGREFLITGLRLLAANQSLVIPPSWWAKVKTFLQLVVVGWIVTHVTASSILDHTSGPLHTFFEYDHVRVFTIAIWLVSVVTVWTGIEYIMKYFSLIRSVLK